MPAIATASRPELCQIYTKHAGRRKRNRVTGWHKEDIVVSTLLLFWLAFATQSTASDLSLHTRVATVSTLFFFLLFFFLVLLLPSDRDLNTNKLLTRLCLDSARFPP